jgi:cytochrome c oxidase subunit 1
MVIAIPTGIKIFSWMATLWGGAINWKTPALYATGFLITFTYGGLTGFFLAAIPADYHEHGTYFVVAHFHYVLYGGSIMSLFAGLYYWWPKMTGRMYNEKLGQLQFWLTFIGFNATFTPMHWLGLMGMPRRVATYDPQFTFWNQFATISSYVMAAGALLFIYILIDSLRNGKKAGPNPWGARTLEWMVSSPAPYYNFKKIPAVLAAPYDFGNPLPYLGLEAAPGATEATPTHSSHPVPTHL